MRFSAALILGHRCRGAATAEAIENKVTFVRRCFKDAFQKTFRLLCVVAQTLAAHVVNRSNVGPNILQRHPRQLIFIHNQAWHSSFLLWPENPLLCVKLLKS